MNHKDAKHFTWDQRLTLERMLKKGFTKAAIASALGKCERSIYYEINRGLCVQQTSEYEFIEVYCPEVAERKYRDFLKDKGRDLKIGKDHALARRLEELVMVQGFAPEPPLRKSATTGRSMPPRYARTRFIITSIGGCVPAPHPGAPAQQGPPPLCRQE